MKVFVSFDGDHIGRMVGRASLTDQPEEVAKIAQAIERGNEIWRSWVMSHGGKVINIGGDEGRLEVEADHLTELPKIRDQYQAVVGSTVSVGVGTKLSEADKSLMAAKLQGGDRIQLYTETVNELLEELEEKPEGEKLFEEYLDPDTALQKAQPGMNVGANAGFSGASRAAPAAPRSEASEHSEAEAARAVYGQPTPQPGDEASVNYEDLFHQIAAQTPKEVSQEPSGLQDGVRAQVVKILQDIRSKADALEQMRTSNPDAYESVKGLVQAMIAMAQGADGQEPVQKAEGKVGQCKWKLGERRCQRQVTGDYCHSHKDHWANKIRQRADQVKSELKKAKPPHPAGPVTADQLTELGQLTPDAVPYGLPKPGESGSNDHSAMGPSQRRVWGRDFGDAKTLTPNVPKRPFTVIFNHPVTQEEQRYIVPAHTFAQAAHAARIHFHERTGLGAGTGRVGKLGVPVPDRKASANIQVDEARGHDVIFDDTPGAIYSVGHEGAPVDVVAGGWNDEPWWTRQPDGSVTRPDGRVYWDLREPNTDDLPINKALPPTTRAANEQAHNEHLVMQDAVREQFPVETATTQASQGVMHTEEPARRAALGGPWSDKARHVQATDEKYTRKLVSKHPQNRSEAEVDNRGRIATTDNWNRNRNSPWRAPNSPLDTPDFAQEIQDQFQIPDFNHDYGQGTLTWERSHPSDLAEGPWVIREYRAGHEPRVWSVIPGSDGEIQSMTGPRPWSGRLTHEAEQEREQALRAHLKQYLQANPNVYKSQLEKADLMPGGKGDNKPDAKFDADQLAAGIKREMEEHGLDEARAREIAKDHLTEDPKYYATEKAALDPGKTGRHQVVLPVGAQIDSGPSADHEAGKIKVRNPEDGKTKWRSVRAGVVMAPDGTPTSSRNPGG